MGQHGAREDRSRFETFVSLKRSSLIRTAGRILKDPEEAEDLVQATLAEVWKRLSDQPPRKLNAYVFRAVRLNALKRRARRRRVVSLEDVAEPSAGPAEPDHEQDEIDPITLEEALAGLPETQQAVLRMKFYLGLTFRQVAEALSISANTAASRYRYALAKLRKIMLNQKQVEPERRGEQR